MVESKCFAIAKVIDNLNFRAQMHPISNPIDFNPMIHAKILIPTVIMRIKVLQRATSRIYWLIACIENRILANAC